MKKLFLILFATLFLSCSFETPVKFTDKVLTSNLYTIDDKLINFAEIINQHKGKKIVLDVWASWCADCVRGFPAVKNLQKEYPDVVFIFLSVDKNIHDWKKGISRFDIIGEHYYVENDFDSELANFLGLSWIPRYVVINEKGDISLFKAKQASDENIIIALKK